MVAPAIVPVVFVVGATITIPAVIIAALRVIKKRIFKKFARKRNQNLKNCESLIIISEVSKQCNYEKDMENIVKAD